MEGKKRSRGRGVGCAGCCATPARQSSCRDTIQKSFYVSSACLAAWHFLALLPSDGENVGRESGEGGKGETTAACNAWLRCLAAQQVAREGESWQFPSDELRKHTKPKTFAKNVKRNACPSIRVSARPRVRSPSSAPAQFQHQGLSLSSQLSALRVLSSQFARPFVSVCLSACLVHPSVCLSQSQSQSQPQSPALSLSNSLSV